MTKQKNALPFLLVWAVGGHRYRCRYRSVIMASEAWPVLRKKSKKNGFTLEVSTKLRRMGVSTAVRIRLVVVCK